MSRNNFSSVPNGHGISDAIGGAAYLQWSLNTIFGTDPTTLAIKQQTALLNKQHQYEKNLELVNNIYEKCAALLNQCVDIFEQYKQDVNEKLSLEFLYEEHENCDLRLEEFHNTLTSLLASGDSRRAAKYYDAKIAETVQPIAFHRAWVEAMQNIGVGLWDQLVEANKTFRDPKYVEEVKTAYNGRWEKIIEKAEKLHEMNREGFKSVESEIEIVVPIAEANRMLFDDSIELTNQFVDYTLEAWEGFKNRTELTQEQMLHGATILTKLQENEKEWLSKDKIVRAHINRLEEKLSEISLAISPNDKSQEQVNNSISNKLKELDSLLNSKLVSQDEYNKLRAKAIENFN